MEKWIDISVRSWGGELYSNLWNKKNSSNSGIKEAANCYERILTAVSSTSILSHECLPYVNTMARYNFGKRSFWCPELYCAGKLARKGSLLSIERTGDLLEY